MKLSASMAAGTVVVNLLQVTTGDTLLALSRKLQGVLVPGTVRTVVGGGQAVPGRGRWLTSGI